MIAGFDLSRLLQDLTPILLMAAGGFLILNERRMATLEERLRSVTRELQLIRIVLTKGSLSNDET